jgi:AcrR family transcriptional regulator
MKVSNGTAPKRRMPAADRRERILAVARETFIGNGEGINGVSVRAIAARGGIDEALIYRHFGSKESLYAEVVTAEVGAVVQRLLARTGDLAITEHSAEREQREWRLTYEFIRALLALPPEVLRAIASLLGGDPEHSHSFYTDALAPALRTLEQIIAEEMANWTHGPYTPPLTLRVALATSLWHVMERDLTTRDTDPADLARQLTDLIFYGIAAPDTGRAAQRDS